MQNIQTNNNNKNQKNHLLVQLKCAQTFLARTTTTSCINVVDASKSEVR